MDVTREQVLRFRHHQQRLAGAGAQDDCPILDLGGQDTGGPRAARWALALRGCEVDSPPVLQRIDGWGGAATSAPVHLDPIRAVLHFLGPTTPKQVAGYLDAPVRTVRRCWPDGTREVAVDGEPREVLVEDLDVLRDAPPASGVRLLGAFDPWLQTRDRELLVADPGRRKDLWRTLGRPGGVLAGHEVVGTWRPRSNGATLRLFVEIWDGGDPPAGIDDEAERLAFHRGQRFGGYADR
jgi:hypothetical protein